MTIATLQPIGERAAAASRDGQLFLLDISAKGITIGGTLFADAGPSAPPRTYHAMKLVTWADVHIGGAEKVAEGLELVIEQIAARAETLHAG